MVFDAAEYAERLARVRLRMMRLGIDVLVESDPANMYYLTGYDGWSFYIPQAVILPLEKTDPLWIGRGLDDGLRFRRGFDNRFGLGCDFSDGLRFRRSLCNGFRFWRGWGWRGRRDRACGGIGRGGEIGCFLTLLCAAAGGAPGGGGDPPQDQQADENARADHREREGQPRRAARDQRFGRLKVHHGALPTLFPESIWSR